MGMSYNKRERIGQLRQRILLEKYTVTQDAFGGEVRAWVEVGPLWASIEYNATRGGEREVSDRLTALVHATIRIRYREDVDESMRVLHRKERYQIARLMPDPKRQYIDLSCIIDEPRAAQTDKP